MAACKTDSSVPEFVGLQVEEWLKEIEEKKEPDDAVNGGDQGGTWKSLIQINFKHTDNYLQ